MNAWESITNDKFILNTIQGYKIPFIAIPNQDPKNYPRKSFSASDTLLIEKELLHLTTINAIKKCKPEPGQFLSDIFLVPKKDGSMRFILNLKNLNKYVYTEHFKMEDIRTATKLVTEGCYMTNIDLKEAYLLLPIHQSHRKFLRFCFKNNIYEFTALPFGLSSAPYIFTKILQPVASHLRSLGFQSVRYLDDLLCIGNTKEDCITNANRTIECLEKLGFIINYTKSNLIPGKESSYLGFVLDSKIMCLKLPQKKRNNILERTKKMLSTKNIRIRDFASFLGTLTAACPAIAYSWVYTKSLERAKYLALLKFNDDYDKFMAVPDSVREDLRWWQNNILTGINPIQRYNYVQEIFTDASTTGWGAASNGEKTGGQWTDIERKNHINYLELLAAYFGLKSFAHDKINCNILLRVDNTTAISYVNRMGGVQYPHLNYVAKMIWKWCEERSIFIFASYIKSSLNIEADSESRKINIDGEWQLQDKAFIKVIQKFGRPEIDLFASRINAKCPKYIAWKKDPYAYNIDAFTINWKPFFFYAFPPFALILKALNKIVADNATGIVIVPYWPSQPWYPLFKTLSMGEVLFFPPSKYLLSSAFRSTHPLHRHLTLAASVLSGKALSKREYQSLL